MNVKADEKLLKKLGLRLRQLRTAKQLSLRHLADEADVDFSHLYNVEKGDVNPSYLFLIKLAAALNMTLQELLDFE